MRALLNTLYVLSENSYLSLDGENIVIKPKDGEESRRPLHLFSHIISFSYSGASPALLGYCMSHGIGFTFCTPRGRFLARISGMSNGNVLLRREQYRIADVEYRSCQIVRNMIAGKLHNQRCIIERTKRNHGLRVDIEKLSHASGIIKACEQEVQNMSDFEGIRGQEAVAAKVYFDVFDELILGEKFMFTFSSRNRRPPLDPVNALLSFGYSILANDCAAAAEAYGLDCYVGFLHRDRPGRKSLALDLMEEFRPAMVDRLVLSLINNRQVGKADFEFMEDGAVLLSDKGRKTFITAWQTMKMDEIMHPYLKEKMQWGIVPFIQAQLLSRYIRGDIDGYPVFLWR